MYNDIIQKQKTETMLQVLRGQKGWTEMGGPKSGHYGHRGGRGGKGHPGGSRPSGKGEEAAPINPNDIIDDIKASFKAGKSPTMLQGEWTKERGKRGRLSWVQEQDGVRYSLEGSASTTYKKVGPGKRLREPSGTRYGTTIDLVTRIPDKRPQFSEIYHRAVRGEHNYNKLDDMRAKVAKKVERVFGIPAEEFTFRHR